jgi:two-component system, chemotaxis family, sensor kinase CheA
VAKGEPIAFELDDDDLKLFTEEADEQLELLDTSLVQLEGEPDPQLVQQIFRAAHTLKGSSATIGHKKMASLTHAMENVLDMVRMDRLKPTSDVVDALLAALDSLRALATEVRTKVDSGTETAHHEAVLHGILNAEHSAAAPTPTAEAAAANDRPGLSAEVASAAREELHHGKTVFSVSIIIDPDCQLPSIRCFQLLQEMDAIGLVLSVSPDRAAIESGVGDSTVTAILATTAGDDQVIAALMAVSDVGYVEPAALTEADLESNAAPAAQPRPDLRVVERTQAADAPRAAASPAPADSKKTTQSVRIDVERLDGLMNLVGELVIDRTRLQQIREHLAPYLKAANLSELTENFEETTAHLARITDELQEEIMRSRMLPVRSVLTRLPRVVRDVAAKCGKKVELITAGEDTELDRSVIEEISDPLVHILRNAVDHGVETPEERLAAGKPEVGTISVTAWNQETFIYLSVKDDGKGIDTDTLRRKVVERGLVSREVAESITEEQAVNYIFLPGLSTAKQISDVSGRGVGMDIVRTNIERLNGQVTVRSTKGVGSEFIIQLPLTLATSQALMIMCNQTVYAVPLISVTEALAEQNADIHSVGGQRMLRLRGELLPLIDLAEALEDYSEPANPGPRFVIAARHGDRQVAFIVDRLLGEQDVVVKSLGTLIGNRRGLTGATILGDGTLGLIVDIASLIPDSTLLATA